MIFIIDYGLGNLGSIHNMLKRLSIPNTITSNPTEVEKADKFILPGVGSFDDGMKNIRATGLLTALNYAVIEKQIPILGICLGMQLMTRNSQEGNLSGLGWIDAETIKLTSIDKSIKIPHMGWNIAKPAKPNSLFSTVEEERFYFVHSYFVRLKDNQEQLAYTEYGERFTSAFQRNNIFGVQFHPEKSHRFGMNLLKKFNAL